MYVGMFILDSGFIAWLFVFTKFGKHFWVSLLTSIIIWLRCEAKQTLLHANDSCADQSAHLHSLISAIVIRSL